jgi:hypothetical protein
VGRISVRIGLRLSSRIIVNSSPGPEVRRFPRTLGVFHTNCPQFSEMLWIRDRRGGRRETPVNGILEIAMSSTKRRRDNLEE